MGNLPDCRLEPGMVFRNTGVDFFWCCVTKKRRVKLKVRLFVCLHG